MDVRRTLEEVIAVYSLEPKIKDVFVEGTTDKSFVEWFLKANGTTDVGVYPIEQVDIPANLLQRYKLPGGCNRSRLVALACELALAYPVGLTVLCLADRDFEDYRSTKAQSPYLVLTDCNSLDLYAFTPSTLEKFSAIALGALPMATSDLIQNMDLVLQRLYALRLANEVLGWGMRWIPFSKYIRAATHRIVFDETRFIQAYLQKNYRWDNRDRFLRKLQEVERNLSRHAGRRTRGHDFTELLLIVIRALRKDRQFGNLETLEGCLMAALEYAQLCEAPFFKRILALAAS